jgi:hypothetical protein
LQSNDLSSAPRPVADVSKRVSGRAKRLVVVALLNIAIGLLSIFMLIFIFTSPKVPAEVVPSVWSAVFSLAIATSMIVASLLALLGLPGWRRPALVIGLVFFGIILLRSLLAAIDPQSLTGEMPTDEVRRKLWAAVVRTVFEIGLTWWGFQSVRSKAFFESRRAEA